MSRQGDNKVRRQGKITKWKDEQGFGFITPIRGGKQVFVHIKSFSNRQRRPLGNETVTYDVISDDQGRLRAEAVVFIGDSYKVPSRGGNNLLAIPALFLMFVTVSVLLGQLPFVVLGLYLVASAVSFFVYAHDKSAAKRDQWRTPERTLHALSLLGGWPGGLIAQKLLRHKSTKQSFQIVFWVTVVLNCVGLAWLFSPSGVAALRSVLGAAGSSGSVFANQTDLAAGCFDSAPPNQLRRSALV
jgi:uncharacterized membrane protein YsdA (DUF1294 family)/cold shock CspA family protein